MVVDFCGVNIRVFMSLGVKGLGIKGRSLGGGVVVGSRVRIWFIELGFFL